MVLINGDPISLVLTAAVVGIGAGIGSSIGALIFKMFLEERVQKFLDKKHREETFKKLKSSGTSSSKILGNMLGRKNEPFRSREETMGEPRISENK